MHSCHYYIIILRIALRIAISGYTFDSMLQS